MDGDGAGAGGSAAVSAEQPATPCGAGLVLGGEDVLFAQRCNMSVYRFSRNYNGRSRQEAAVDLALAFNNDAAADGLQPALRPEAFLGFSAAELLAWHEVYVVDDEDNVEEELLGSAAT